MQRNFVANPVYWSLCQSPDIGLHKNPNTSWIQIVFKLMNIITLGKWCTQLHGDKHFYASLYLSDHLYSLSISSIIKSTGKYKCFLSFSYGSCFACESKAEGHRNLQFVTKWGRNSGQPVDLIFAIVIWSWGQSYRSELLTCGVFINSS